MRTNTSRRRQLFPEKRSKRFSSGDGPDTDYGLAEPLVDTYSLHEINEKMEKFLAILSQASTEEIEKDTREQSGSQNWYHERKIRLTASYFGQICKMRPNTSCKNNVHNILYAPDTQTKSVQYGRKMESFARSKVEQILNVKIKCCGLVIDSEMPYLAASPGKNVFKTFHSTTYGIFIIR